MLTAYIAAAMRRAHYELLTDQHDLSYYGELPDCPGVWATASTLEACREELQSVLEGWIALGLRMGHAIPSIAGIDINPLLVVEVV